MYYYCYQITNKLNNKIYIGVHKTKNVDDEYMGSGKQLLRAIKKYGIENFKKTIISNFNSEHEMFDFEQNIVNEIFLKRKDVYNLKIGGFGGWTKNHTRFKGKKHTKESKEKIGNKSKNRIIANKTRIKLSKLATGRKMKEETKKKISKSLRGSKKTEETKRKMSLANLGKKYPERDKKIYKNRPKRYWISNDCLCKSMLLSNIEQYLKNGWIEGRKY